MGRSVKTMLLGLSAAVSASLAGAPASAATEPGRGRSFVLTHVNVIDGVSAAPIMDATVVVTDGRIASVGRGVAPAGTKVVDAKGQWLLPGFIDAHAHVGDMAAAQRALQTGITTLGEAGVSHFADIGLRQLNRSGVAALPDIVAAGYHLRPFLADEYFLDFPEDKDLMTGVRGADAVRRVVRRMASRGVDRIKILSTERSGLASSFPRVRVFDDEELAAIVDEAHKHKLKVIAHAHGDEGAAAAVRAGVDGIEHGTFISEATLRLMKQRGTFLDPTISVRLDSAAYPDPIVQMRGKSDMPAMQVVIAGARKLGVRIVAGSDNGYAKSSARSIPDEIVALAGAGLPPMEAIRAATSEAAAALGVDERTGAIQAGKEADLVLVSGNPLQDVRFVADIVMIVNDGELIRNYLDIAPRFDCVGGGGVACRIGAAANAPGK